MRNISRKGWIELASWTIFGTAGCLAVSLTFNWLAFRNADAQEFSAVMTSATVLPIIIAGPLFFYLTLKLRELAIANHKLARLASTDNLTGILNRGAFTGRVEHHLGETPGMSGALLIVDVDRFKRINDSFGHDQGDAALRVISDAVAASLRSNDIVGRLGGEEFGVFLPGASAPVGAEIAERIRNAVSAADFSPDGRAHKLSVSIGCVVFSGGATYEELFRMADDRLYEAKRTGRNRIAVAHAPSIVPDDLDGATDQRVGTGVSPR